MPPRKKAAAAPVAALPLANYIFTMTGTFKELSHSEISELVTRLGGKCHTTFTRDITHLISTAWDHEKQKPKVKTAQDRDIPIVCLQWLLNGVASGKMEPIEDYLYETTVPDPVAPPSPVAPPVTVLPVQTGRASRKRAATASDGTTAVADVAAPVSKPAKKVKTAPTSAPKPTVNIPVDLGCNIQGASVYVNDEGEFWDASMNQTNALNNNNKFYRLQILVDGDGVFWTWARWGRVGERGQSSATADESFEKALKAFKQKFRSKTGLPWEERANDPHDGKYTFVETNYDETDDEGDEAVDSSANSNAKKQKESGVEDESEEPEPLKSKLPKPVGSLMELIFDLKYFEATMSSFNYDANKLPLGKLSKATISRGFQTLKDLAELLEDHTLALTLYTTNLAHAIEILSNRYYSVIPHAFGRNRPPIIHRTEQLRKETELLESLSDMKDAELLVKLGKQKQDADHAAVHLLDQRFETLNLQEMTPLEKNSSEFGELESYLFGTRGATHDANYKIADIFRIEREGEGARFEKGLVPTKAGSQGSDRRLLWHGSGVTNFGGILSQGLRIAPPEAPVSGYMFGKGIYFADMSSKSAGYCKAFCSGRTGLLLLCEVELGKPMLELTDSSYEAGETAHKAGRFATLGQGMTAPKAWKDAGCVHPSLEGVQMPDVSVPPAQTGVKDAKLLYNEYIVYDISQVRLRYLLRVVM